MDSTLADRFRYLRKIRHQATQDALAEVMEAKRSRVADIERGKVRELKAEEAVKIASHFNIDGWWLITGLGQAEKSVGGQDETIHKDVDVGNIPHNKSEAFMHGSRADKDRHTDFITMMVPDSRFEPLVPMGATLYVDSARDPKDGEYLLIKSDHGLYIKQYSIGLGDFEGQILVNRQGNSQWPLAAIAEKGAEVIGVIVEFRKNLFVEYFHKSDS